MKVIRASEKQIRPQTMKQKNENKGKNVRSMILCNDKFRVVLHNIYRYINQDPRRKLKLQQTLPLTLKQWVLFSVNGRDMSQNSCYFSYIIIHII